MIKWLEPTTAVPGGYQEVLIATRISSIDEEDQEFVYDTATYFWKDDTVDEELAERVTMDLVEEIKGRKLTPIERLEFAMFSKGKRLITEDGFYQYEEDKNTGFMHYKRLDDKHITYWALLNSPE